MLWIKNNAPIEFDYKQWEYIKGLKNKKNPNNKSQIVIVNLSDDEDLGPGTQHRDVFTPDEIEIDLLDRALEAFNFSYIKFLLLLAVDPGTPILPHVHRYPGENESHFQSVLALSPKNDIDGLYVNDVRFNLSGHNHILLNIKMNHWVEAQKDPTIYVTPFASRLK